MLNLTMGWGFDLSEPRPTVYQAMLNPADTAQCVVNIRPNLDLLPASLDLAGAERQFMMDMYNPTNKLKKALAPIARSYDFVLVDPPPTLGFFMANPKVRFAMDRIANTTVGTPEQGPGCSAGDLIGPVIQNVDSSRR